MRFLAGALAAALFCCVHAAPAQAETEPTADPAVAENDAAPPGAAKWRAIFSPYTVHFSYDPLHKPVVMFGLERERADGILLGGALFDNSFGQPSAFVFGGQRLYRWSPWDPLYAEWTAGLLYGYKGEFRHKVPLNVNGFSPGLALALGWQYSPTAAAQVNLLGTSGLMFQFSIDLP
jgi:hypothetical protein